MAYTIKLRDVEGAVKRLNVAAGYPEDTPLYTRDADGKYRATIGMYQLSGAYGGGKLEQIVSEGGGVRSITHGYLSKREVYNMINAYREGMQAKSER